MDLSRRAYTTACRFLRDSDTVSQIRWSECHPDALAIPYTSAILSLDLERSDSKEWPVGEVDGAPRPFIRDVTPAGLIGDHVCGTPEDFEQGGEYRPDLPPAEYATDGFLKCCNPPKVIHGGFGAGGHAAPIHYATLARPGGLGAGGHARPSYQYNVDPTEGGFEMGGEGGDVFSPPAAAEGGFEMGGECGDVFESGPPTPGTSCSTALSVAIGVTYSFTSPSNTTDAQWFHFSVANGDYHFDTSGFTFAIPPVATGLAQDGSSCAGLVPRSTFSTPCNGVTIIFGGGIWLRVTSQFGYLSVPYSFTLQNGLCPP